MHQPIVISGTGLYTPPHVISNDEIVASFNAYVTQHNERHANEIANGTREALKESTAEFIEKASGIKNRHVVDKEGILDVNRMCPTILERPDSETSVQCDMSVAAAKEAMAQAGKTAEDIDLVIVSSAGIQRAYPALAVEVQDQLGISGYAYDMNVACSAATFAIQNAADAIVSGSARCVLTVNPEIMTGVANFRERDSHFIFGDVATAMILERADTCTVADAFEILGSKVLTKFSNNVRSNFGFLNRCDPANADRPEKLFHQNGLKVFKEVIPIASKLIKGHLADLDIDLDNLRRMWLHQANSNMNRVISEKVMGRNVTPDDAPTVLENYANTASAGSIVAFHLHRDDLKEGDIGVICSFGAGYSAGSVVIRKGMPAN